MASVVKFPGEFYVNADAVGLVQPLSPDTCRIHFLGSPLGSATQDVYVPAEEVAKVLSGTHEFSEEQLARGASALPSGKMKGATFTGG